MIRRDTACLNDQTLKMELTKSASLFLANGEQSHYNTHASSNREYIRQGEREPEGPERPSHTFRSLPEAWQHCDIHVFLFLVRYTSHPKGFDALAASWTRQKKPAFSLFAKVTMP